MGRLQQAYLKPPPESYSKAHYPVDEIEALPCFDEKRECTPLCRYPTLEEVSRLPSSRHFADLCLEDENEQPVEEPLTVTETIREDDQKERADDDGQLSSNEVYIEIAPGVVKLLRGSRETQCAWDNGLCEHVCCISCESQLACVWDCEFVLCPECHTMTSLASSSSSTKGMNESIPSLQSSITSFASDLNESFSQRSSHEPRGVGLGIRLS